MFNQKPKVLTFLHTYMEIVMLIPNVLYNGDPRDTVDTFW
jgi:hypothetical protein